MTLMEIKVVLARHEVHTLQAGAFDSSQTRTGGMCSLCYCSTWIVEALEWLVAELDKEPV